MEADAPPLVALKHVTGLRGCRGGGSGADGGARGGNEGDGGCNGGGGGLVHAAGR